MHFQHDNYGFSVPVVFRSKARCEGKGQGWPVSEASALGLPLSSTATQLRDTTGTPCGLACQPPRTALRLLARVWAITGETRLAANVDKLTEPAIIMLEVH